MSEQASDLQVTVKLYGLLRDYHPHKEEPPHRAFTLSVPSGASLMTVLDLLGIPEEIVAGAARNGDTVSLETGIESEDDLRYFSPIAGGGGPKSDRT